MDLEKLYLVISVTIVISLVSYPSSVTAGDIVYDDDSAPKKPGCENDFVLVELQCCFFSSAQFLVKVQTWINGIEDAEFVGVGARFGTTIVSKEKNANQTRFTLSDHQDYCTPPKKKLDRDNIMVDRGKCKFTTKENNAEAAGASAVLIINNQKELYKMVCEPNETDLDIKIPAIMLPQDAGASLEKMLLNSSSGTFLTLGKKRGDLNILWTKGEPERVCSHVHLEHSHELNMEKRPKPADSSNA